MERVFSLIKIQCILRVLLFRSGTSGIWGTRCPTLELAVVHSIAHQAKHNGNNLESALMPQKLRLVFEMQLFVLACWQMYISLDTSNLRVPLLRQ